MGEPTYIEVLRDITGHDETTCENVLDASDNGNLLQFLSMVSQRKYPHLEYAIKNAIRWEVQDILKQQEK